MENDENKVAETPVETSTEETTGTVPATETEEGAPESTDSADSEAAA